MTPPWDWAIRESGAPRFATRRLRTRRGLVYMSGKPFNIACVAERGLGP